jgi:hypothetical protein
MITRLAISDTRGNPSLDTIHRPHSNEALHRHPSLHREGRQAMMPGTDGPGCRMALNNRLAPAFASLAPENLLRFAARPPGNVG